jgi:hypothetical protein
MAEESAGSVVRARGTIQPAREVEMSSVAPLLTPGQSHLRVRELPASERPRERLALRGAAGLTSAELIALVWGSGTRGRSATELAGEALGRHDEWKNLLTEIRTKYGNRPRFMEILDRLEGRTILESRKKRRR